MTDTIAYILIAVLAVLIAMSAFFSGAETAYSSVKYSKVEADVRKKKRAPKLIAKHYKSFGRTLATILICNNLVNVLSAALMTMMISQFVTSSSLVMVISTFVMTPILVAFGEITPKLLAKKYSYGYLKRIAYTMEVLNVIFFPLTYPIGKLTLQARVTNTESELKTIIGLAAREGVLEKREATLAQNALDLDSTQVGDIYTPKSKVVSVKLGSTVVDAKEVFHNSGHSRIPVMDNDKFVGVIMLKDIVFKNEGIIDESVVQASRVSKNKVATKALEMLRKEKRHIAFVTRPSSSVIIGIVTLEDIVEELIGEIYDEHDKVESVNQLSLHKYEVDGSVPMIEFESLINNKFDESEGLTVKQWIQSRINRNIKTGLVYRYKDKYNFKIVSNKNGEETVIEITQK